MGIGKIVGYATLKRTLKKTEYFWGPISDIEGKRIQVIERNPRGCCLALTNDGLVDIHEDDIEHYEAAAPDMLKAFMKKSRP